MAIKNDFLDADDTTLFKNRLWKLMKRKDENLDGPRKLATLLYDEGHKLVKKKKEESFDERWKVRSDAIGSMEKKIRIHINSDSADCLDGDYVAAYCDVLNCSADYLFGQTDIQSGDIEIRRICEITGLTEEAIIAIKSITEPASASVLERMHAQESKDLLNKLLTAERLVDFIEGLKDLDEAYQIPKRKKKLEDDLRSKLGQTLLDEASEWHDKLDEAYEGPEPRPELCEAVKMFKDVINKKYEIDGKFELMMKVTRYELHEVYTKLIDELYPLPPAPKRRAPQKIDAGRYQ